MTYWGIRVAANGVRTGGGLYGGTIRKILRQAQYRADRQIRSQRLLITWITSILLLAGNGLPGFGDIEISNRGHRNNLFESATKGRYDLPTDLPIRDRPCRRIGLPTIPNAQPVTGCGSERFSVDRFVLQSVTGFDGFCGLPE